MWDRVCRHYLNYRSSGCEITCIMLLSCLFEMINTQLDCELRATAWTLLSLSMHTVDHSLAICSGISLRTFQSLSLLQFNTSAGQSIPCRSAATTSTPQAMPSRANICAFRGIFHPCDSLQSQSHPPASSNAALIGPTGIVRIRDASGVAHQWWPEGNAAGIAKQAPVSPPKPAFLMSFSHWPPANSEISALWDPPTIPNDGILSNNFSKELCGTVPIDKIA